MPGGTRSFEMARRLVASGHQVNMITSDRSRTAIRGWYQSNEHGIQVHWLPVPYNNTMPYPDRIRAFLRYAVNTGLYAAHFEADLVFATIRTCQKKIGRIWLQFAS